MTKVFYSKRDAEVFASCLRSKYKGARIKVVYRYDYCLVEMEG